MKKNKKILLYLRQTTKPTSNRKHRRIAAKFGVLVKGTNTPSVEYPQGRKFARSKKIPKLSQYEKND